MLEKIELEKCKTSVSKVGNEFFIGRRLVVWWYGGFMKNRDFGAQPRVTVFFKKIDQKGYVSSNYLRYPLAMTSLGQFRIGTVWDNGICNHSAMYETKTFDVDFSEGMYAIHRISECSEICDGYLNAASLDSHNKELRSYGIFFQSNNKSTLCVPCNEFFLRCYGRSQEVKRVIATYPWGTAEDKLYDQTHSEEYSDKWPIKLRYNMVNGDTVFLAHVKYDDYAKRAAKSIYAQLESEFDKSDYAFISVKPWFKGPASIRVKGIDLGNNFFLGLQVIGGSDPCGNEILRDRDNTNVTGPPDENTKHGSAWQGAKRKNESRTPGIIDLVDDEEPDQGAPTIDVEDQDYIVLGNPRLVETVKRDRTNSTSGLPGSTETPNKYSGGEPYSSGKGVGKASIQAPQILESKGTLRDVWEALKYVHNKYNEMVGPPQWFTFSNGFVENNDAELIPLRSISNQEVETINKLMIKEKRRKLVISRSWVYIDVSTQRKRGVLVARIMINRSPVYLIEIQRRQVRKQDSLGKFVAKEESFKGMAFQLDNEPDFRQWINDVLGDIRFFKGSFEGILKKCPGKAVTFKHVSSKKDAVPCEAAVLNAFKKLGILFST